MAKADAQAVEAADFVIERADVIELLRQIRRVLGDAGFELRYRAVRLLNTLGKARWQRATHRAIAVLRDVFWPDHIALGGGNAKYLDPLPEGCDRGDNQDAFRGALRLWPGTDMLAEPLVTTWRIKRSPKKENGK